VLRNDPASCPIIADVCNELQPASDTGVPAPFPGGVFVGGIVLGLGCCVLAIGGYFVYNRVFNRGEGKT